MDRFTREALSLTLKGACSATRFRGMVASADRILPMSGTG